MIGILETRYRRSWLKASYRFEDTVINALHDDAGLNHGINYGAIPKSLGRVDSGFFFFNEGGDYIGSRVEIPDNELFKFKKRFTVEGFVCFYDSGDHFIISKRNASTGDEWQLVYLSGNIRFDVWDFEGIQYTYQAPYTINEFETYHIAAVFDKNIDHSLKILINATEVNGTPNGPLPNLKKAGEPITFGKPTWSRTIGLTAVLDEWNIHAEKALTSGEINKIIALKPSPPTPSVNIQNLVASFNFEDTTLSVIDAQNGYNGTISGAVTSEVPGLVGNCFDFAGGEVRIPHNTAFHLNDGVNNRNLAFSLWINFDTIGDSWFFNKRGNSNDQEYQFCYYLGELMLRIWNSDGTFFNWVKPETFTVGEWVHLSGFTDIATNKVSIFRDAVFLNGTTTGTFKTIRTNTTDFVIGRAAWATSFPFLGKMDEPRFWIGDEVPKGLVTHEFNYGNGITL